MDENLDNYWANQSNYDNTDWGNNDSAQENWETNNTQNDWSMDTNSWDVGNNQNNWANETNSWNTNDTTNTDWGTND